MSMRESQKKYLYWSTQIGGWFLYIILLGFSQYANNKLNSSAYILLFSSFFLGIIATHLLRLTIIRRKWFSNKLKIVLPRIVLSSVFIGIVISIIEYFISLFFIVGIRIEKIQIIVLSFGWILLVFLWSILYFLFHFIENSRKQEIENLKLEALRKEIELNNLKSQLNPHFMFNCLNSIRALISENPDKSKEAITQLANILREALVMERKKLVNLKEELKLVKDYLSLEQIRYEERLKIIYNINTAVMNSLIPPLMLQTIVENGIKHGISKLKDGGEIHISAFAKEDYTILEVENTGQMEINNTKKDGVGLENTRNRLRLLYGDKAILSIDNKEKTVITRIKIPVK